MLNDMPRVWISITVFKSRFDVECDIVAPSRAPSSSPSQKPPSPNFVAIPKKHLHQPQTSPVKHHARHPVGHSSMLPTPDFSHVAFERVYEPAEDSFLFLDTLSAAPETDFLHERFSNGRDGDGTTPVVVEIGPGSGVVIGFINAHAEVIFGSRHILATAIDVNAFACRATDETAAKAARDHAATSGMYLGALQGDLVAPLKDASVDVLVFNPPYVPTEELPKQPAESDTFASPTTFEDDSYLLSLSYAGGPDGMHTTSRLISELPRVLSPRGCAYLLVCDQNRPDHVKQHIRDFGSEWRAETVGSSGMKAGWEKLQIIRIWRV
jgi:release factor glutamine methyltransferase